MEVVDLCARVGGERDMDRRDRSLGRAQPEEGSTRVPEPDCAGKLHDDADAQGRKRTEVERLARFEVVYTYSDVVKHLRLLRSHCRSSLLGVFGGNFSNPWRHSVVKHRTHQLVVLGGYFSIHFFREVVIPRRVPITLVEFVCRYL